MCDVVLSRLLLDSWGDQALFSVIERNDPSLCKILDHHFMLNRCQRYYNISDPKSLPVQGKEVGTQDWGALHFNCADMPDCKSEFLTVHNL